MGYYVESGIGSEGNCLPAPFRPVSQLSGDGLRYYIPAVGRWLSRDPIDEAGSAAQKRLIELVRLHALDRRQACTRTGDCADAVVAVAPEVMTRVLQNCPPLAIALSGVGEYGFCHGQPTTLVDVDGALSVPEVVLATLFLYWLTSELNDIVMEQKKKKMELQEKGDDGQFGLNYGLCKKVNTDIAISAATGPPLFGSPKSVKEVVMEESALKTEQTLLESLLEWLLSSWSTEQTPPPQVDNYLIPLK